MKETVARQNVDVSKWVGRQTKGFQEPVTKYSSCKWEEGESALADL